MAATTSSNKLILIDGSSFLYRAYFAARQNFSTKDGLPTGATFIMTRMMRGLVKDFPGQKFVMVFDAPGPSFRKTMYPDYKATRVAMPDELVQQVQWVHSIVKAMNFPMVIMSGVEADDVLGSYAQLGVAAGFEVIIATGDKDLAQLVNDQNQVSLLDTMKNQTFKEADILNKFGVTADHIIDFLALKGDSSDNIPGMKGVGDKTAIALISALGGIYDIKQRIDEVSGLKFRGAGTFKKRFLEEWDNIELSYKLATIKTDVPVPIALDDLNVPYDDNDTLIALFERLEFHSFAYSQRMIKGSQQLLEAAAKAANEANGIDQNNMSIQDQAQNVAPAGSDSSMQPEPPAEDVLQSGKARTIHVTLPTIASIAAAEAMAKGIVSTIEEGDNIELLPTPPQKIIHRKNFGSDLDESKCLAQAQVFTDPTEAPASHNIAKQQAREIAAGALDASYSHKDELLATAKANLANTLKEEDNNLDITLIADVSNENSVIKALKEHKPHELVSRYHDCFKMVNTEKDLEQMVVTLKAASYFSIAIEANSSRAVDAFIVGISFCSSLNDVFYVPLRHSYLGVPAQLPWDYVKSQIKELLEQTDYRKITYDFKRARMLMHFAGIELDGFMPDPMLMAHIINSNRSEELSFLAETFLSYSPINYNKITHDRTTSNEFMDIEVFKNFICEKAHIIYRLYQPCLDWLKMIPHGLELLEFETKVANVVYHMERFGTLLNSNELARQSRALKESMFLVEQDIYDLAGLNFNIQSPKQLGRTLFEQMKLPYPSGKKPKKDRLGQPIFSTGDEILSELADQYPIVGKIQRYRMLYKLISSYTDKLSTLISPRTGRLHTCFNVVGTITGRLSSSDPNLQNIPARTNEGKQIRSAFTAPPGYVIVSADYSQIELRLIAHFSQEPNLIEAFKQGKDIHKATAAEVLGKPIEDVTEEERKHAKATNFGLMYGMQAHGLARQTQMSKSQAKAYITTYFKRYPKVEEHMQKTIAYAKEHGFVETLLGHRIVIQGIHSTGTTLRSAERTAINAPMQGSAADIIKKAMIAVDEYISTLPPDSAHMTMQVHDELVFEVKKELVPEFSAKVKELMENVVTLSVPLEVGIGVGSSWAKAH